MLLAMIMSLAQASDRPSAGKIENPRIEQVYKIARHVCRKGHSPTDVALKGDELRRDAEDLSRAVTGMLAQLPDLEDNPRLSPTERATVQTTLEPMTADLATVNRDLLRSLDLSGQVRTTLIGSRERIRRHERPWSVRLCAGDQLQLAGAVVNAGHALDRSEQALLQVMLIILEAMSVDPNT